MSLPHTGFTLVELLITVLIAAVLLMASAPLVSDWVFAAQTHSARSELVQAFDLAKALALRNPNHVTLPAPAAGIRVATDGTTTTVLVCAGSAGDPGCIAGGANVQWSGTYSGRVSTAINGVVAVAGKPLTIDLDDRAQTATAPTFLLQRGGAQNNEAGPLF